MSTLSRDTSPEAERIQIELLRQMPSWRKMALVTQLTQMSYALALTGLRNRHPEASQEELQRRLADQILGSELAARVYGPLPEEEE
jgi:hypothetical protein